VREANNGANALDILTRGDAVDLVFMPGGVSGWDVATRACELKPAVRILLTSGYAEELVRGDDLQRQQFRVLRKPYRQADLVAALREALGGGREPRG
jgi:CheY-like chemotaxis protein